MASRLGSLNGNVVLSAGGAYTQIASDVVAANDVSITAARIDLLTADDTWASSSKDDSLKIGAFARVRSPLIDLLNNAEAARHADGRVQAMQGMAAAANAYQAASAISSLAGGPGSGTLFSAEAGVGFASSSNASNDRSQAAHNMIRATHAPSLELSALQALAFVVVGFVRVRRLRRRWRWQRR